jgi:hypothetical protein
MPYRLRATPTGDDRFAGVRLGGIGRCDNDYDDRTSIPHGGYRGSEGVVGIERLKEGFMKIRVGDVIGLEGEFAGFIVEEVWSDKEVLLCGGRIANTSDIYVVRTDNEDGTATETFSDGRIRTVELE